MCTLLAHASQCIVQYRDSFTWSKYSQCVFPIDFSYDFSERMISEMNNVDELFHQNMTSFSKLILMDLLIFCWVKPPFILLKNTWRLFIRLHWTLMEYHPFWRNTPVGTYILRFSWAGGVYKRYFWASTSSETCAPGGSYFTYSVFLGVTLACLMHSPESLFPDLQ